MQVDQSHSVLEVHLEGKSQQNQKHGISENLQGSQLTERIVALGDWFHNININGIWTAPNHFLGDFPNVKWKNISKAFPEDLAGASVLDIGCNGGFYSIALKKRGAGRVLGVDVDDRYLKQARFAAETLGLAIDFQKRVESLIQFLGGVERRRNRGTGTSFATRDAIPQADYVIDHYGFVLTVIFQQSELQTLRPILSPRSSAPEFRGQAILARRSLVEKRFPDRFPIVTKDWLLPGRIHQFPDDNGPRLSCRPQVH